MDMEVEQALFPPLAQVEHKVPKEFRKIPVPPNRLTPLRQAWEEIIAPIVEHLKLQIRFNTRIKRVELRTSPQTEDKSAIQKAADFVRAFICGFELADAIAMLRLEDIYLETFEIKDVRTLEGDHLSRCIGRIAGEKGRTKHAIENSTRTRIILADTKIHVMGSHSNVKAARTAICNLIMGKTPGKVYSQLRGVSRRLKERG